MSDRPSHNLSGLAIDLARRIDEVCRQFEADWREGRRLRTEDYLIDVSHEGRPALRSELEALERELRRSDETVARPDSGPGPAAEPQMGTSPFAIAEAPTMASGPPLTTPILGAAPSLIDEESTISPSDRPRSPKDQHTAAALEQDPLTTTGVSESTRIRYFGDYEIVREIARGGMGVVFQARQLSLNRPVALKMILAGQLANETDILRFYLEAEAAANLDHPGIVPIYEVGQHEGQHYFSMGFVEGESLSQRLADGPLPCRQAAALLRKIAEAIEYAHGHGVVHRDLKPGNILLDQAGNPRVTDFGLAKRVQDGSELTGSGQIMGTPSYMPPEQAGGNRGEVGPAADVYALGAMSYCMVTGRPPFQAATAMDTVLQVISDDPVPLRRLNPAVDRDLETICLKCLEKEPLRRYGSAAALGEDLRRYLDGEPIVARPVAAWERAVKWARRRPAIAGLAAALAAALVVGFTGMALLWGRAENNAAIARSNETKARLSAQTEAEARTEAQKQAGIARLNERKAQESARTEAVARAEAQKNAAVATEKAEALRRQDYISRVNLAYQECLDNNVTRALELLEGCPQDLRSWEWHYVSRQCHLDLQTFRESEPSVNAVAFSPDGRRLASGSGSVLAAQGGAGDLVVRDVATGGEVLAHRGLSGGVYAVAFSPDGRWLAAGHGTTLTLWDAATGRERFHKSSGSNTVDSLAFTPDSQRIIAGCGGEPGYSKIWDAATGDVLGDPLPGFEGNCASVAVSPDGRQAAVGSPGRVDVWDLQTRKPIRTLRGHESKIYAVAFSPDGRYLASGGWDRTIRLWDCSTGSQIRVLRGHEGFVRSLAFSPDSRLLVSAAEDKSIKLWSVGSDRDLGTLHGHQHYVIGVAFSPDGHLIASGSVDQTLKVWFATPTPQLTFQGHTGWVNTVAFSPDGHQVASGSSLYTTVDFLQLWDSGTGELLRTFPAERAQITSVAFSADGRKLATSGGDGTVKVWDAASGRLNFLLRGGAARIYEPANVAFSPDGRRLALADVDGSVRMWDATTGRGPEILKGHTAEANGVAFSPDGQKLASGSSDKTVRVWDAATGRELLTLKGHTRRVASVTFSPDGCLLASVGGLERQLGEVKVWDLATGRERYQALGHTDTVSGVAFSPDGRRLATASDDRTIKLWDTATGQDVFTLRGHTSGILCVVFSPDGQRIASGSIDRTAKVWDTAQPSADQLLQRLAAPRVADLFRSLMLKNDVIDQIRRDAKLDESLRAASLQIAERTPEHPMILNNTSWMIARESNRTPDDYRRALRYAEAACRLAPQESTFIKTLGVARYRAGQYREALADLNRSLELNSPRYGGPIPADLAFVALAQQRLGQNAEALMTLGRLREVMSRRPWSNDDESEAFSDEANSLIAGIKPPIVEIARFVDDSREVNEFATFSSDGRRILACSVDGALRLWGRESGRLIRRLDGREGRLLSVAFSPDGRRALSGGADQVVRLWDLDSGKLVREFPGHSEWIFNVAFSPDGRLGYSTSGGPDAWHDGLDSAVRVWDLETGHVIRKLEGHKGRVFGLAVSPDGHKVLTGGDTSLILWDAQSGKSIRRIGGHTGLIGNATFLPGGGLRAVSGSFDRTIRLWDLESGQELHRFLGHPREVTWVAASPDGRRLLSSDYNGHELRLWDVEGRKLIRRLGWGRTAPTRGSFSPDSRHAIWTGTDGVVRLYQLTPSGGADRPTPPDQPARPDASGKPSIKN
jgi:eukaryotic-like serine/threonine-protein kinase